MAAIQNTLLYRDIERRRAELEQSQRENEYVARQYAQMAEKSARDAKETREQEKHDAEQSAMLLQQLGGDYKSSDYSSSAGRGGAALGFMKGQMQDRKTHESRAFDAAKQRAAQEHSEEIRQLIEGGMDRRSDAQMRFGQSKHDDMMDIERRKLRQQKDALAAESGEAERERTAEYIKFLQADLRTLSASEPKMTELGSSRAAEYSDLIDKVRSNLEKAEQFYMGESGRPNYYILSPEQKELMRSMEREAKRRAEEEAAKITPQQRAMGAIPSDWMVDDQDTGMGVVHTPGVNDAVVERLRQEGVPVLSEEEAQLKNPSFGDIFSNAMAQVSSPGTPAALRRSERLMDLRKGVVERDERRSSRSAEEQRKRNAEIEKNILMSMMNPDDEAATAAEAMGYSTQPQGPASPVDTVLERILRSSQPLDSIEDPEVVRAIMAAKSGR